MARDSDPLYLAVRAQTASAGDRVGEARALHYPSIGVTVAGNRVTNTIPYAQPPVSSEVDVGVGVSLQQTLYNRGNDLLIRQAEINNRASQMTLSEAEEDLILRVAQAYFDVLSATGALETVRANESAVGDQLYAAKRKYEVGESSITDSLEATSRHDLATEQLSAAESEVNQRQIALTRIAGRAGIVPIPLTLPFAPPPLATSNVGDWVRLAEQSSPALQRAQAAWDVAKLETQRAHAANWPTIVAKASIGRARSRYDFQAAADYPAVSGSGAVENSQVGVAITFPLFSGFYIRNRVNETNSLEEKARYDYESALNEVRSSTETALEIVESGRRRLRSLETAAQSSADACEALRLGFKVGMNTNMEVLNAQTQLYLTRKNLVVARYGELRAILRLLRSTGQLKDTDVAQMDGLLRAD